MSVRASISPCVAVRRHVCAFAATTLAAIPLAACTGTSFQPDSGKLLATGGVSQVEGAGGAGLSTWALVSGYGSEESWGGAAFATRAKLDDFDLTSVGGAVGLRDRIEVSYAHQTFDTSETGATLGLGEGYIFEQDVVGAKLRVAGDAVYGQDSWMPQIAVGAQYKRAADPALLSALGARDRDGVDYYASATKVILDRNVILSGAVRATRANHLGLLGFGGDRKGGHSLQFEGSAAYMLRRNLVIGADYRTKPDNLSFAEEGDAVAAYVAAFPHDNISVTAAAVDIGPVAGQGRQRGFYGSVQFGF